MIERYPDICAVYSSGGGNRAIANAFDAAGLPCSVFVGHDLDEDNLDLLRRGRLSLVIHHELRRDARSACQLILKHQRLLPPSFEVASSTIGIITPFNLPEPV